MNVTSTTHILASPSQVGALILTFVTSTLVFARRVLVLNRFAWPPTSLQWTCYGITLSSGALFWVTLNNLTKDVVQQFVFGLVSTVLGWCVLTLLVNKRVKYPSRQQRMSLFFYALTEASILLQVRLVLMDLDARKTTTTTGCSSP